jgi:DNA-binding beta-propeller fold protein YncE
MFRFLVTLVAVAVSTETAAASSRVLVVSRDEKALKSFDASTYELQFAVALPGDPHHVVASPDGRFAYSADFEGRNNTVSIVDLAKGERVDGIKMDPSYKPHDLAITRDGTKLYVTCEGSKVAVEVDLVERKVARRFKLNALNLHNLALSPDERYLFVTSQWDNNVSIVDLEAGKFDRAIATGNGAEGVAVTPDGKEAWVVNRVWQTLAIIDVPARKRVETMSCTHNPMRVVITPDGKTVIVSAGRSGEVVLIDRAKREEVARVSTGDFPVGMALTQDASRLYVANMNGGDVGVVDLRKRELIHRFEVGAKPEGIAVVE